MTRLDPWRVRWVTVVTIGTTCVGCAGQAPTPEAPSGKGWYLFAQGYHQFTATSSQQSYGKATVTTTTVTSRFNNARQHENHQAGAVPRKMTVGHNVADYGFNEDLREESQP